MNIPSNNFPINVKNIMPVNAVINCGKIEFIFNTALYSMRLENL